MHACINSRVRFVLMVLYRYAVTTAREAKLQSDMWNLHVEELCQRLRGYDAMTMDKTKFKDVQKTKDDMSHRNKPLSFNSFVDHLIIE